MKHNRFGILTFALLASAGFGCAQSRYVDVPSQNHNSRVNYLVIHFTTENFADSLALLTEPSDNPVSSHYLIPEPRDPTYSRRDIKVFRLVDESRRAWHAGSSYWDGEEALNDRSIGIELVNRAGCSDDTPDGIIDVDAVCRFPEFDDRQISLLIDLAQEILSRYPDIDPVDVVAHADIAPDRKVDPGPKFPWRRLHDAGIGAWYDEDTFARFHEELSAAPPPVSAVQRALSAYGYRIEATGNVDETSLRVLRAFQMHFLPESQSGEFDARTAATAYALLERYRPERLQEVLTFTREHRQ